MNIPIRGCFLCLIALLILPYTADAETRIYTTSKVNPAKPMIDGRLDEEVWKSVPWGGAFVQHEPHEGDPPTQQTRFKILYDDEYLYVGFRCCDTDCDKIVRRVTRRDTEDGDRVGIHLDTYFDHRTAFVFTITAAGVKIDEVASEDGDNWDNSWDPVWSVEVAEDDSGWTAEARIPFSQLRFGSNKEQVWGLQFHRYLHRKEEFSSWQHVPQDAPGWVSCFGELHGLTGIKSSRRIELLPYTVGQVERFLKEEGNPFATGSLEKLSGGLDGKLGVTSDLTLDFTVNPDFGQVEADPSVLNLSAFETFYHEKRPFFIEGKSILDFGITPGDSPYSNDTPFYSRRVGRFPHHWPDTDDDEYLDMPQNTSIIGAAKLSGKTRSGLSVGVLDAVTARETAEIDLNGNRRTEEVEPLTNYFTARVRQDYDQGNTVVGGIVTAIHRDLGAPELNYLHRNAYTGGVDVSHSWADRTYSVDLSTVFSHVRGSTEALLETQTSSVHYFQRPDADYLQMDSTATSMSGHGGSLTFSKSGSGHISYALSSNWRSPGLDLNDMGFLNRADANMNFVWVGYRIWDPVSIFRRININLNGWNGLNFDPEILFSGGNINGSAQFTNYWGVSGGINRDQEGLSMHALRGGPMLKYPGSWNNWFFAHTDGRKQVEFWVSGSYNWSDDGFSSYRQISPGLSWQPSNALSLSADPSYSINKDHLMYVDTAELDDGDRYIMASLAQKTFSLTFRANYSLTPELSIQYYGQPFISVGKYREFKQISNTPRADPYEDRFNEFTSDQLTYYADDEMYGVDEDVDGSDDYYFDKPDFNFREFRSNLVVRWEYRPGSTLYVVWSQGRSEYEVNGDFGFGKDMRALFDTYPGNTFLVKINHWFSL
jgi:hypothetical protein